MKKMPFERSGIPLEPITLKTLYYAPAPVFIASDDGNLLYVNKTVQNATGFEQGELPTLDALTKHLTPYLETNNEPRNSSFFQTDGALSTTSQVIVKSAAGKSLIWQLFHVPLGKNDDGLNIILSIAQDVTDSIAQQKRMEILMNQLEQEVSNRTEALNSTIAKLENEIIEKNHISDALTLSRERLKKISRHTLDVLEADRQTISKELHDSIGASLAAIKFSLEEKEMLRTQNGNHLSESLNREVGYLAATIKETKRISANLRPSTLDDLGLVATITWYLREFHRLYGDIIIEYDSEVSEQDIPEAMKINIYRIIQEGLTNAERHSNASVVRLSMKYCDGNRSISLSIEDNGCGFDIKEIQSNKDPLGGYGLIAMRERCEIFGGFFLIDSEVDGGTHINAILPLK